HSTLTGDPIDTALLGPEYWYRNLRETVRFEPVVRRLLEEGQRAFIEVGPHPVLTFGLQQSVDSVLGQEADSVAVLGTLRRAEGGTERFAISLAQASTSGVKVDWGAFFAGTSARRVKLPTYPFQREALSPDSQAVPGDRTSALDSGATSAVGSLPLE